MKYFPDQNELQMRQRLKVFFLSDCFVSCVMMPAFQEFMEYHRRGPHQGFWRLKASWTIPSDADMLKMVGPEQVVLSESMQVGQRHLQDAGYSQVADVAEGDESNLSVEQQLAPWITTKNFLFATQAKAMLRLHGDGDPTGRGEAFSFIRISMKDIFVKAGEDYEQKMGNYFCYACKFYHLSVLIS
jgi:transcription initiation factor TFIID subunit 1